eukprot:6010215-Pleurochrysis_carterae.AAC.2
MPCVQACAHAGQSSGRSGPSQGPPTTPCERHISAWPSCLAPTAALPLSDASAMRSSLPPEPLSQNEPSGQRRSGNVDKCAWTARNNITVRGTLLHRGNQ